MYSSYCFSTISISLLVYLLWLFAVLVLVRIKSFVLDGIAVVDDIIVMFVAGITPAVGGPYVDQLFELTCRKSVRQLN